MRVEDALSSAPQQAKPTRKIAKRFNEEGICDGFAQCLFSLCTVFDVTGYRNAICSSVGADVLDSPSRHKELIILLYCEKICLCRTGCRGRQPLRMDGLHFLCRSHIECDFCRRRVRNLRRSRCALTRLRFCFVSFRSSLRNIHFAKLRLRKNPNQDPSQRSPLPVILERSEESWERAACSRMTDWDFCSAQDDTRGTLQGALNKYCFWYAKRQPFDCRV